MSNLDPIAEWSAAQQRVIELVEGISAEDAQRIVPATPDWTVRDLLAHVIGLDADTLVFNEPDDHNDTWTQAQVDERAGKDVAALLDEWRAMSETVPQWMRENNPRPMGDVVIHEQDLRGALGVPGARDSAALASIFDMMAERCALNVQEKELEPLRLEGDTYVYGPPNAEVVVRAPDFDLLRLVLARRSVDQLRSYTAQGDIEPYIDCFGAFGPLRDTDLVE